MRLQAVLEQHAPAGSRRLPRVRDARLAGVEFSSSNCQNFLIEVDFDGGPAPGLPRTLYAKMPPPELATRAFANAVGFWEVELTFCQRIAHRVPIETPHVYAAARQGARFVLLLENLRERPGVRLFENRDMAAGSTPERAERCLEALAALHAEFWNTPPAERDAIHPMRLHPHLAPGARARSRALAEASVTPAQRRAPDLLTDDHARLCRSAIARWDALVDVWFEEPLTLLHGDSHLANCFETTTDAGPAIGLLDFQGLHWGQGMRDVQYHLAFSLDPKTLAEHEDALIAHYLECLSAHGVSLAPNLARRQYCVLSFQTLVVALVSLGLGSLTEREDTMRTVLARSLAAVERTGFDGWLGQA